MAYDGYFERSFRNSDGQYIVPADALAQAEQALLLDIRDLLIEIRDRLPEKAVPGPSKEELLAEELKRGYAFVRLVEDTGEKMPSYKKAVQFSVDGFLGYEFIVFQEPNGNWMLHAVKDSHKVAHGVVSGGFTDLANVAKHIDLWITEYIQTGQPPKPGDGQ